MLLSLAMWLSSSQWDISTSGSSWETSLRDVKSGLFLLHSTGNSAQCHVAISVGGAFGENGYMNGLIPLLFTWNHHCIVNWLCAVCLVAQSCPTLCNLMVCSLLGSSVHGILQARILEWVSMPSSRGSFQPRDQTQVSHIAGSLFTDWASREAQEYWSRYSPI